jgi:hypothetical protein
MKLTLKLGETIVRILLENNRTSFQRDETQIFLLKLYKLAMIIDSPFGNRFCNETVSIRI